jgi:hypothetical protein
MILIDERTRQRIYDLSRLVTDIDGSLSPTMIPSSTELDFEHGLFLHPSPLRSIGLWVEGDVWMFRNLDHNILDGSVYHVSDAQALAPVDHPKLAEQLARMLARCGREIISSVADRIIVPRDQVADVFEDDLVGAARMAFAARAWLTRNGFQGEW